MTLCISSMLFIFIIGSYNIKYVRTLQCYTKYNISEEGMEISSMMAMRTPENESCSMVGCSCYSFKTMCSMSSPIEPAYSPCNPQEQQLGVTKWKWGCTSTRKCNELRQQHQTYRDMVCCEMNLCNNQPHSSTPYMPIPNEASIVFRPNVLTCFMAHLCVLIYLIFDKK